MFKVKKSKIPTSSDKAEAEKCYKEGLALYNEGADPEDVLKWYRKALKYNPKHQDSLRELKLLEDNQSLQEKKNEKRHFSSIKSSAKRSKFSNQDTDPIKRSLFQAEDEKPNTINNNSKIATIEPSLANLKEKLEQHEELNLNSTLQEAILNLQKEFEPKVSCSVIKHKFNFDAIPIEEYQSHHQKNLHNRDKKLQLNHPKVKWSKLAKSQIGEWGETFIYYKLKCDYEKHYDIKETDSGFEGMHQDKTKSLELTWHLKSNKPQHCVDFTLIEQDKNQKKTEYIEVKSTSNNKPSNAKFSKAEIDAMRRYGSQYKILRLYNIGNEFKTNANNNVKIKEIKNPKEKIFHSSALSNIELTSIKLKI